MSEQVSKKNDRTDGKLMWELLPLQDIEDVVKVYTEGAKKYGPNNWQNLDNGYQRYKAEETGCRHLAQVVWNAIALLHISKENKDGKYIQDTTLESCKKSTKVM